MDVITKVFITFLILALTMMGFGIHIDNHTWSDRCRNTGFALACCAVAAFIARLWMVVL